MPLCRWVLTGPTMHDAAAWFVDSGSRAGARPRRFTRRPSQSDYSFGTQDSIEAGVAAAAPGRDVCHHGTLWLHV